MTPAPSPETGGLETTAEERATAAANIEMIHAYPVDTQGN